MGKGRVGGERGCEELERRWRGRHASPRVRAGARPASSPAWALGPGPLQLRQLSERDQETPRLPVSASSLPPPCLSLKATLSAHHLPLQAGLSSWLPRAKPPRSLIQLPSQSQAPHLGQKPTPEAITMP